MRRAQQVGKPRGSCLVLRPSVPLASRRVTLVESITANAGIFWVAMALACRMEITGAATDRKSRRTDVRSTSRCRVINGVVDERERSDDGC
jgi:hypothetical protein